jgi:hypothetical protein
MNESGDWSKKRNEIRRTTRGDHKRNLHLVGIERENIGKSERSLDSEREGAGEKYTCKGVARW